MSSTGKTKLKRSNNNRWEQKWIWDEHLARYQATNVQKLQMNGVQQVKENISNAK